MSFLKGPEQVIVLSDRGKWDRRDTGKFPGRFLRPMGRCDLSSILDHKYYVNSQYVFFIATLG